MCRWSSYGISGRLLHFIYCSGVYHFRPHLHTSKIFKTEYRVGRTFSEDLILAVLLMLLDSLTINPIWTNNFKNKTLNFTLIKKKYTVFSHHPPPPSDKMLFSVITTRHYKSVFYDTRTVRTPQNYDLGTCKINRPLFFRNSPKRQ